MEVKPETVTPYLPSLIRVRHPEGYATMAARDFSRTIIASNSKEGMMLTVPLKGGASAAKRKRPGQLEISDHGDWTRIHLGAIDAAYGREPFFGHCFPAIEPIITNYPPRLADMNRALMDALLESIGHPASIKEIEEFSRLHPGRYSDIRKRLESKTDPTHSIIETIFRFGPDALFLLRESQDLISQDHTAQEGRKVTKEK